MSRDAAPVVSVAVCVFCGRAQETSLMMDTISGPACSRCAAKLQ